jgi:hypothetical protein
MSTYTTRFHPIRRYAKRSGKCPICGKRVQRQRTFEQTVNPYHPAITPNMSGYEAHSAVAASVEAEARSWEPDFTHEACKDGAR